MVTYISLLPCPTLPHPAGSLTQPSAICACVCSLPCRWVLLPDYVEGRKVDVWRYVCAALWACPLPHKEVLDKMGEEGVSSCVFLCLLVSFHACIVGRGELFGKLDVNHSVIDASSSPVCPCNSARHFNQSLARLSCLPCLHRPAPSTPA